MDAPGFSWETPVSNVGATHEPTDWAEIKRQIIDALGPAGVCRAWEDLGVRFSEPLSDQPGWRSCHALDRPDEHASACVHTGTGFYNDSGGGTRGHYWDLAGRYGGPADWLAALKQLASMAGLDWSKVTVRRDSKGQILQAIYNYADDTGTIRYRIERWTRSDGSKTFRAAVPGDKQGTWRSGRGCMEGVRPLPYRLPEILARPDEPVWIVEGEKDVDRLIHLGRVATTNHGGAQATARWDELRHWFKDRDVYIVPDNDPVGWKHALGVAKILLGTARIIAIVPLPGLPPKGDLSDWLDLGKTIEEIEKLPKLTIEQFEKKLDTGTADAGQGKQTEPPKPPLIILASQVETREVEWLWPGRIPLGKLTTFAGWGGLGKSFVTADLIARLTTGRAWPFVDREAGDDTLPASALIINSEDDPSDTTVPRLSLAGADLDRVRFLHAYHLASFSLDKRDVLDAAIDDQTKLIVIDPAAAHLGERVDEHKNASLRGLLAPLTIWAQQRAVAIVLITHVNKMASGNVDAAARVIGSVAWVNAVRSALIFLRDPDDREQRIMYSVKTNLAREPKGIKYRLEECEGHARVEWLCEVDPSGVDDASRGPGRPAQGKDATGWLIDRFRERNTWSSNELCERAKTEGISRDALWRAKEKLKDKDGVWPRADKVGTAWQWTVPPNWSAFEANGMNGAAF